MRLTIIGGTPRGDDRDASLVAESHASTGALALAERECEVRSAPSSDHQPVAGSDPRLPWTQPRGGCASISHPGYAARAASRSALERRAVDEDVRPSPFASQVCREDRRRVGPSREPVTRMRRDGVMLTNCPSDGITTGHRGGKDVLRPSARGSTRTSASFLSLLVEAQAELIPEVDRAPLQGIRRSRLDGIVGGFADVGPADDPMAVSV